MAENKKQKKIKGKRCLRKKMLKKAKGSGTTEG